MRSKRKETSKSRTDSKNVMPIAKSTQKFEENKTSRDRISTKKSIVMDDSPAPERSALVLWSTSTGRAKACARRTCRMLRSRAGVSILSTSSSSTSSTLPEAESTPNSTAEDDSSIMSSLFGGMSFDDFGPERFVNVAKVTPKSSASSSGKQPPWLILFVSTTGDGEHCDTIQQCWNVLLQKSLPKNQFEGVKFALFSLGDRAYGEAFCAAGRKLASRLVQLGATPLCRVGYGDDGTPNGGVFADLDEWLVDHLLPAVDHATDKAETLEREISRQKEDTVQVESPKKFEKDDMPKLFQPPYRVTFLDDERTIDQNNNNPFVDNLNHDDGSFISLDDFYRTLCPLTSYVYDTNGERRVRIKDEEVTANETMKEQQKQLSSGASTHYVQQQSQPLVAKTVQNERITASDWEQDVRHLRIVVLGSSSTSTSSNDGDPLSSSFRGMTSEIFSPSDTTELPYDAGDVAVVLPRNSDNSVQQFLDALPYHIKDQADQPINIEQLYADATPWPQKRCTFRKLLKCCVDINGRPEREFLRWLSVFIDKDHPQGKDQASKLVELSEPSGAALFADYILREKRNYADVFYDFDGLRSSCCKERQNVITLEHLLALLPPLRPRHFSIASSPSNDATLTYSDKNELSLSDGANGTNAKEMASYGSFAIELCVAVVEGTTPLGRSYRGLCSGFLKDCVPISSNEISTASQEERAELRLWIRPGTFGKVPLSCRAATETVDKMEDDSTKLSTDNNKPPSPSFSLIPLSFDRPVMCIGAGTGIAPLRGIIREREAKALKLSRSEEPRTMNPNPADNILVFGCRHEKCDFHYGNEWHEMGERNFLSLYTAFSRDQYRKIYVQGLLKEHNLVLQHLVDRQGALYVAGGAKMAKCVRDEIIEILGSALSGGEKEAKLYLKRLQKKGLFSVEAWS